MTANDLSYLSENLFKLRQKIEAATKRSGRDLKEVRLVGVSKTVGRAEVAEMWRLGLQDFGENRVADAEERFRPFPAEIGSQKLPTLHLIGHLQTNKAKRAVALFDLVHSVDSLNLAQTLDKQANLISKRLPILLQVNVSGEESKEGMNPAELPAMVAEILKLPNLELRGLMTIAPNVDDPELTRPVFRELKQLFENYKNLGPQWSELSMGMTNDFEVAIEEGATLVRIGRALFQPS